MKMSSKMLQNILKNLSKARSSSHVQNGFCNNFTQCTYFSTVKFNHSFNGAKPTFRLEKRGIICQTRLGNVLRKDNLKRSVHNIPDEKDGFIFRQLLEYRSFTYTYLLADLNNGEAVLVDPVIETVARDIRLIGELGLNLKYGVNTHVHADHVTGTGELKKLVPTCQSMIAEVSGAKADVGLRDRDKIKFGQFELEVRSTPGHTDGCLSFVLHEKSMVFTGDALLIRGCGRTDFQQGDSNTLYNSVHQQLYSLPEHFRVYPGHDYTGQTVSTIGEEKKFNSRLSRSKSEFTKVMENLKLPYPKQIEKSLPANMICGVVD